MITVDCEQRSQQWFDARAGIPTASEFGRIITPKTGKLSAQAIPYRNRLLAEWLTGHVDDTQRPDTYWMQRGSELEQEAVDFYEMQRDVKVTRPGFIYRDDRRIVGCSPDALGKVGVEIKCPAPGTHMGYLLGTANPALEYRPQVQGSMWICGMDSWDFLSYHPDMPPVLVTIPRDDYADELGAVVEDFIADMLSCRAQLIERGYKVA